MFKILTTLLFLFFSLSQTAFARDHYCHGALGMQCGEARLGQVGFCKVILEPIPVALCGVNAGSWRHDECCAKQPANNPGMMCNGGGERSTQCQREWNTAVTRFTGGYNWLRLVNTKINDTTPETIDRPRFCGKSGAKIHQADGNTPYCCSGQSRGPGMLEALFNPNLRYCR
ncbi:MAG: hypothetical protein JG718_05250 [Candidatus Thiothrix moscowensis]|nr:hypothetical protein [Candidatus Thiothrix moscowensis]